MIVYTYHPHAIFDDLFTVTIYKHTILYKRKWLVFKQRVRRSEVLFSGLNGDANDFMKTHPNIDFRLGFAIGVMNLPEIK